ncbi:MAG: hypothetical protein ACPGN3_15305 [Opitutales bacterium]
MKTRLLCTLFLLPLHITLAESISTGKFNLRYDDEPQTTSTGWAVSADFSNSHETAWIGTFTFSDKDIDGDTLNDSFSITLQGIAENGKITAGSSQWRISRGTNMTFSLKDFPENQLSSNGERILLDNFKYTYASIDHRSGGAYTISHGSAQKTGHSEDKGFSFKSDSFSILSEEQTTQYRLRLTNFKIDVSTVKIPEPGAYAAFAGCLGMLLVAFNRKRKL